MRRLHSPDLIVGVVFGEARINVRLLYFGCSKNREAPPAITGMSGAAAFCGGDGDYSSVEGSPPASNKR